MTSRSTIVGHARAVVAQPRAKAVREFEKRLVAFVRSVDESDWLAVTYWGNSIEDVAIDVTLETNDAGETKLSELEELFSDSGSPLQLDGLRAQSRRLDVLPADVSQGPDATHAWHIEPRYIDDSSGTRRLPVEIGRGAKSLDQLFSALLGCQGWTVSISIKKCADENAALLELMQQHRRQRPRAGELAEVIAAQGLPLDVSFVVRGPGPTLPIRLSSALAALIVGGELEPLTDPSWLTLAAPEALALFRLPIVAGASLAGVPVVPAQLVRASHELQFTDSTGYVRLAGAVDHAGRQRSILLSDQDLDRHLYVPGQTGSGKSTFLRGLAADLARKGQGFLFIDPHGDTADRLIGELPPERSDDIVFIDASDLTSPAPNKPICRRRLAPT